MSVRSVPLEARIRSLEADLETVRHSLNIKSVDLESMRMERDAAVARAEAAAGQAEAMRKALEFTVPFRDFSDEWHDTTNAAVVRFRELRQAALAHDAGKPFLPPQ